jgi:hypothetical protein
MTQWAKAVVFTEKGIVATKGCKPKFEELTAYFKAYDSRDETIGRGTHREYARIRSFGRALRRPPLPPSSGLRPKGQCRDRRGYQLRGGEVEKGRKDLSFDHLRPAHHLGTCSTATDQLLQRFQYTVCHVVGELEQFN